MSIIEFLTDLKTRGIKVYVSDGNLKCEAHKDVLTSELKIELTNKKKDILDFLSARDSHRKPPLKAVSRNGRLPLSYAQQRLWILNQIEPGNTAYNEPGALKLSGPLHIQILKKTINEIIRRHEILRTVFVTVDGEPVQIIKPELNIPITIINLGNLSPDLYEQEFWNVVNEELQLPFNLSEGPLLRIKLLYIKKEEHVLLFNLHHIITDGWSQSVLVDEFCTLYEAFQAGLSSPLVNLPIQYVDFSQWQREWLQGEILEKQLSYWRERLASVPTLQLPADRERPVAQSYCGATLHFFLPESVSDGLIALSRIQNATLFMTFLAAFNVLLARYSGQNDICVGTPVANRDTLDLEGLIGFFANTLVLRTNLAGNPSFIEYLDRVKNVTLSAQSHQDLPFERLVSELQPIRDTSKNPLFQVMFVLQNSRKESFKVADLEISQLMLNSNTSKFDLLLLVENDENGCRCEFEYNLDIFDEDRISRMSGHFINLLAGIIEAPESRLSELPMLTEIERKQAALSGKHIESAYQQAKCIHLWFEEEVSKFSSAVAVVFEKQEISYRELNARANQLAHYLRDMGVRPDVLVGIGMYRSIEMIVGVLGVLKAGGGYLPIDPSYPTDRIGFILEDTQCSILLTQESLLNRFSSFKANNIICLDIDNRLFDSQLFDNLPSTTTLDNLAYVLYTSGSTGRPKGVAMPHGGLANLINWQKQRSTRGLTTLQYAFLGFDVSFQEIFATFLQGGCLVLVSEAQRNDFEALIEVIRNKAVERLFLPFVALQQLAEISCENCTSLDNLKEVITAGEQLKISDSIAALFQSINATLHNQYGPTEAHVVTEHTLSEQTTSWPKLPSIGRPVDNTSIYLLDEYLNPVPIGVTGELYIGGIGLARGYMNRPAMTAEKFVPNPFGETAGGRFYRTGDLARYDAEGNIYFLGRKDNQVKVRGFRVELGEIEARLLEHHSVRNAVVIVGEPIPDRKQLIAYVSNYSEKSISGEELKEFLKKLLPDYMIPSYFILMEDFPVNANGKVDRKALPQFSSVYQSEQNYVAPRTWMESALAKVWRDLLLVERISIHDNFFELGGDSILAIQAVSRAKQVGIRIKVPDIFQHQTIALLAEVAAQLAPDFVETNQEPVQGDVPLTPIQHWFFEHRLPNPSHWNMALLLGINLPVDESALKESLSCLVAHHDALRLRFFRQEDNWRQTHIAGIQGQYTFEKMDLTVLDDHLQVVEMQLAMDQYQESLDISSGPLMRFLLFELGNDKPSRLFIVIHHLIMDVVSLRIMVEDLLIGYQQRQRGESVLLPPKTTSFKDWSLMLSEYANSNTLNREAEYWKTLTKDPVKRIPIDYPEGKNLRSSITTLDTFLDKDRTRTLLSVIPKVHKAKINEILLTAFVRVLCRWNNCQIMPLAVEGHGRESLFPSVDHSRTIGWFTSISPVILECPSDTSINLALTAIKQQLDSIPNNGIGYGILRYISTMEDHSQISTQAYPQVSFNYLGQTDQTLPDNSVFTLIMEKTGEALDPSSHRLFEIEVESIVAHNQLNIQWVFSSNRYNYDTIDQLAVQYIKELEEFINYYMK